MDIELDRDKGIHTIAMLNRTFLDIRAVTVWIGPVPVAATP